MAMQTAHEVETASVERALAAALASMRTASEAAAKGRDDFSDVWTAEVMDRQPLVFVAAVLPGETMAWLLDPGNEAVLEAEIAHRFDFAGVGTSRDDIPYRRVASQELWTRLFDSVADGVSWLVRERRGRSLSDYPQWRPETD